MTVRVLIAERDPEFRRLLRAHVETVPGFEVVGHAIDEQRAAGLCGELLPQLVVIGLHDDRSIDDAIVQLRSACPNVKVLVVAGSEVTPPAADAVLTRPVGTDTFVSSLLELADSALAGGGEVTQ